MRLLTNNPIISLLHFTTKYKIFLNKNQFNNLLDKGFIKYKLTDSKKKPATGRWNWFFIINGF